MDVLSSWTQLQVTLWHAVAGYHEHGSGRYGFNKLAIPERN